MTDERLAEIEALRRAATQGRLSYEGGSLFLPYPEGHRWGPSETSAGGSLELEWIPNGSDSVTNANAEADGAFFAAAGAVVDELLAGVRRLRAAEADAGRLKDALRAVRSLAVSGLDREDGLADLDEMVRVVNEVLGDAT